MVGGDGPRDVGGVKAGTLVSDPMVVDDSDPMVVVPVSDPMGAVVPVSDPMVVGDGPRAVVPVSDPMRAVVSVSDPMVVGDGPPAVVVGDPSVVGGEGRRKRRLNSRVPDLPEDVLLDIVSRVDLKIGIRTTAVHSSWYTLWRQSPLDLDDTAIRTALGDRYAEGEMARILNEVAQAHGGPIRRISFSFYWLDLVVHQFNIWKEEGRFDTLDVLLLNFTGKSWTHPGNEPQIVPPCVFSIINLRVVKLQNCFVEPFSSFTSHKLTHLELCNVDALPGVIPYLIKEAHKIKKLIITGSPHIGSLRIEKFRFLQHLLIFLRPDASRGPTSSNSKEFSNLIVKDNPILEEVYITQTIYGPSLTLDGVPNLRFVGAVGWPNRFLVLGNTSFTRATATKLSTQLASVRTACLQMVQINIQQILNYVDCFPRLETLHIKKATNVRKTSDEGEGILLPVTAVLECLQDTLREVLLWDFKSNDAPIDLCKYFLSNAKVLDSVAFVLRWSIDYDKMRILEETISQSLKLADFENAASPHAKIKCCFEKESNKWIDSILTIDMEYGKDPCKFRLGLQFCVFPKAEAQQPKILESDVEKNAQTLVTEQKMKAQILESEGVDAMTPEGSASASPASSEELEESGETSPAAPSSEEATPTTR